MKSNFGEGSIFTVTNYIWWFLMGNFYFWIMNIPFILVFLVTAKSGESNLGIFLVLSAIPMGPALTALFCVMGKLIRERDVDITKDFFKSYKANFFESLFFWVLELLVIGMLYADKVYVISKFNIPVLQVVFTVFIFICISMTFYVFPIVSRFYWKKIEIIKLSFYYLIKKFHIGIIGLGTIYAMWIVANKIAPVILFFSVGILCYVIMFFQKNTLKEIEENIKKQ